MKSLALLPFLLPAFLSGCGDPDKGSTPRDDGPPVLVASFHPPAWLARRLLDGRHEVHTLTPPGEDPLHWQVPLGEPAVRDLLQNATLVILNGAGAETWIDRINLAPARLADLSAGFEERLIEMEGLTHSHGAGGGEHTHEGTDPHVWMDPTLYLLQARALAERLRKTFPEHDAAIAQNALLLEEDLRAIDARWKALAPRLEAARLFANHAAWDYPARTYGFEVRTFELAPDAPLSDALRKRLTAAREEGRPHLMLFEEPPLEATRAALEELGITVVPFAPAESVPGDGEENWLVLMRANLDRLEAALP